MTHSVLLLQLALAAAEGVTDGGRSGGEGSPEQVHLALGGGPAEMTAMWVTQPDAPSRPTAANEATVEYWEAATGPGSRVSARGSTDVFLVPVSWEANGGDFIRSNISRRLLTHNATMLGLKPRTRYGYRVGSNETGGWSSEFFFVSQPTLASLREPGAMPVRVGWVGDMGDTNGRSFPQLEAEALTGSLDALIHVGDIAYDLDTRADESLLRGAPPLDLVVDQGAPPTGNTGLDGGKGDQYMRDFEPVASSIPYMVCPGNHEFNFNHTAFTHRFNGMPAPAANHTIPPEAGANVAGRRNNWWYSFNVGNAHFISLNSGVVIDPLVVTAASRYRWDCEWWLPLISCLADSSRIAPPPSPLPSPARARAPSHV